MIGLTLHIRKKFVSNYVPIIWLALSSLFCDLLSLYLRVEIRNTMPAFHLYGLLHGICLIWFFSLNISRSRAVVWIGGVYLLFYVINSAHFEHILTYNAMAKVIQNFLFVAMSFWYFFDLYRLESKLELESHGIFWIVVGILLYHSGAFFTSLFSAKILSTDDGRLFSTWIVHNLSNLTKNILFLVGLWMGRTR